MEQQQKEQVYESLLQIEALLKYLAQNPTVPEEVISALSSQALSHCHSALELAE